MKTSIRTKRSPLTLAEVTVGGLASVIVVVLVFIAMFYAGPLWRDEINTHWLSTQPLPHLWAWLDKDSYPLVWFMVVRGWIASGLGSTDLGLRGLGSIVGLIHLAAIFFAARLMGKRWPLVLLSFFALNPALYRYGTSLRGNGLGTVTMFVMVGLIWAYVDRPNRRRLFWAFIGALLAVQTHYYNAVILAVVVLAGAAACLVTRRYRDIGWLGAIGLVSALSILPYVIGPLTRAKEWNDIVKVPTSIGDLFYALWIAIDQSSVGQVWVWGVAGVMVCVGCALGLKRWKSRRMRARAVFVLVAAPLLFLLYLGFLLMLSYVVQPWYFMTFLGFLALLLDRGADLLIRQRRDWRALRLVVVLYMMLWPLPGDLWHARCRTTNIDAIAEYVAEHGTPGDVIIVSPWYMGVSFARYYHGPLEWMTMPPVSDFHLHRFDLAREGLRHPEDIEPIEKKVREALQNGRRVWYMGKPLIPAPGPLPPIEPLTRSPSMATYETAWEEHLGAVIRDHARNTKPVGKPLGQPVSPLEAPPLLEFDGGVYGPPEQLSPGGHS
jgi:hypothetical protein